VTSVWQKSEQEVADKMDVAWLQSCAQERIYKGKYFDENLFGYFNSDTLGS